MVVGEDMLFGGVQVPTIIYLNIPIYASIHSLDYIFEKSLNL